MLTYALVLIAASTRKGRARARSRPAREREQHHRKPSMGLSHAVHWWQEWQMRVLVLGSLFVYMSLYFAYSVRRSPKLRNLRFLVWSAYVGGDALAIYALATLFNRQRQRSACGRGGGSSDLEVLWAPVLLIHLGGQTTMSAYSLEDNELWKRHAMTLVSQVRFVLSFYYYFLNRHYIT